MRYTAINAICAGGDTVPIVRDLSSSYDYTLFESMSAAEAEAGRLNEVLEAQILEYARKDAERLAAEAAADDDDEADPQIVESVD